MNSRFKQIFPQKALTAHFYLLLAASLFLSCGSKSAHHKSSVATAAIPSFHSHNDYEQNEPLLLALTCGAKMIEIDIFHEGDALLVGHDKEDLRPELTIEALYFDPLKELIARNKGSVYAGDSSPLLLLIDIKSEAISTYQRLTEVLLEYEPLLSVWENGELKPGALSVIISGNRSAEMMLAETRRLASYDGRLSDLEERTNLSIIELISDNWENHFSWRGDGPIPTHDLEKLQKIAAQVHEEGKILRFWKLPVNHSTSKETVWQLLLDNGVDLINVDDLHRYRQFATSPSSALSED